MQRSFVEKIRTTTSAERVQRALASIADGGMVIVTDDEKRENEGDLIMAAQHASPKAMTFIIRHTSGVVCVALPGDRLDELQLPLMVSQNGDSMGTAFTVSVDAADGITTGISAGDRATTARALAVANTRPRDLVRPGHVFPLRARDGGVLRRAGHTEAAVDLTRLAGLEQAGVLAEIVNEDGTMARGPDLARFASRHNLTMIGIGDLIRYRQMTERIVRSVSHARLPTRHGVFVIHVYESLIDGIQHVALVQGDVAGEGDVLVRVHSECLTGDLLGSMRCDCGVQLSAALSRIAAEGRGVVVYLRGHEGRGIGLGHKIQAYQLQDQGHDTLQANIELGLPGDSRDYSVGAQILADLGVTKMRLMTNNPDKYEGIAEFGLAISERVPLVIKPNADNMRYLRTKQEKMGHLLGL